MKLKRPLVIIEGIDNVGKGTLIENLIQRIGFANVIKYDKPKLTNQDLSLKDYQFESFLNGFGVLSAASSLEETPKVIFDRFHLGELVYSPLYRKYDGHYVMQIEASATSQSDTLLEKTLLVLLTANNFEILADDGKSFDRSAVEREQQLFKEAYDQSWLNKAEICVHDKAGNWRDPGEIADEVVSLMRGD